MEPSLTADGCREALKRVIDPEIFQNIVDLGLVYGVDVQDTDIVDVNMTLTTPHCPMGPQIIADVEKTLKQEGASVVNVNIVWEPMWTPDAMTEELKELLGIIDTAAMHEPEPELLPEEPPLPPKKRGFWQRLFGR